MKPNSPIHAERLQLLRGIIQPIAQSLDSHSIVAAQPNAAPKELIQQDDSRHTLTQDSSLLLEEEDFFPQTADFEVKTVPMGLPPVVGNGSAKPPGRLFEYLRQTGLQRSEREFAELPLRMQAIARLGGLIYTERLNFQHRVYHVMANDVLLGLLDLSKRQFSVLRHVGDALDLSELRYVLRPLEDEGNSDGMDAMAVQDAVWLYGRYDPEALLDLPPELGTHWLRLRKLPSVSAHLLDDRNMALIRSLLLRKHLFVQLLKKTPKKDYPHLLRDLACMFLTRAIEPLPTKA